MQVSVEEIQEETNSIMESDDVTITDEKSNGNVSNKINYVDENNSIEDIIEDLHRLKTSFNNINAKLKNNNLELTKDNYVELLKYSTEINKESSLVNNLLLKKSLKNCISKKNSKVKKNSSVSIKKRVYPEILKFMDISSDSEEILVSQQDIMTYISTYIKTQRDVENSGINVIDKNKRYFNIVNKLKILFEFFHKKVSALESKEKLEKLFPNNEIPEYLQFINLMSYYPYCFINN